MAAVVDDPGGWAPALHDCPHLKEALLDPVTAEEFPSLASEADTTCSVDDCECTECWLSLKTLKVYCGRYGNQHMMEQYRTDETHCIALGISDLSFWCYRCDNYLDHLSIRPIFERYKLAHLSKFGEQVPEDLESRTRFDEIDSLISTLEGIDEEAEMDGDPSSLAEEKEKEEAALTDTPVVSSTTVKTGSSSSASSSSDSSSSSVVRKRDPSLNPLKSDGTAAVRRTGTSGASTALSPDERIEYEEEKDELRKKARLLAMCIKASKHTVVHTGAGISTAAKIPDYRGPRGVWTMRAEGKKVKMEITLEQAKPTYSHMVLKQMMDEQMISHVTTTNVDGLHRRSGLKRSHLCELHGDVYLEYCNVCGCEYLRTFDVTKTRSKSESGRFTGRLCEECGGPLRDSIIAFGENLPKQQLSDSLKQSAMADLVIVIGSSMRVSPACRIPSFCYSKKGIFCLINLQKTPYDKQAHIRVHCKCDEFMTMVCDELNLEVPEFDEAKMITEHEMTLATSFLTDGAFVEGSEDVSTIVDDSGVD